MGPRFLLITIKWTKSHAGTLGNVKADILEKAAIQQTTFEEKNYYHFQLP